MIDPRSFLHICLYIRDGSLSARASVETVQFEASEEISRAIIGI
jgi:hypothetical protein